MRLTVPAVVGAMVIEVNESFAPAMIVLDVVVALSTLTMGGVVIVKFVFVVVVQIVPVPVSVQVADPGVIVRTPAPELEKFAALTVWLLASSVPAVRVSVPETVTVPPAVNVPEDIVKVAAETAFPAVNVPPDMESVDDVVTDPAFVMVPDESVSVLVVANASAKWSVPPAPVFPIAEPNDFPLEVSVWVPEVPVNVIAPVYERVMPEESGRLPVSCRVFDPDQVAANPVKSRLLKINVGKPVLENVIPVPEVTYISWIVRVAELPPLNVAAPDVANSISLRQPAATFPVSIKGAAPVNFRRPLEVQERALVVDTVHAELVPVTVQRPLPIVTVCAVRLFDVKLPIVTTWLFASKVPAVMERAPVVTSASAS